MRWWSVGFVFIVGSAVGLVPSSRAQVDQDDCIAFNPDRIEAREVQGRWKITEGNMWLLDFGNKKDEAEKSLAVLRAQGFDHICYVGRPDPSLTWFEARKPTTTVILVRHAEKGTQPAEDPPLTSVGEKRAETLARMLDKSGASVVFSSQTLLQGNLKPITRTRETVNNYADKKKIPITYYTYGEEAGLVNTILTQHRGKRVLVAGHSDTVPQIIQALGVASPPPIGNEFDNLFIVTIRPGGIATMTHLKYPIDQALYR